MKTFKLNKWAFVAALAVVGVALTVMGVDLHAINADMGMIAMAGAGSLDVIMKSLEKLEGTLASTSAKADEELKAMGKVSADTKTALDNLGTQQREFADRLTQLEQKNTTAPDTKKEDESWGAQVIKHAKFDDFARGQTSKLRIEVKNTLTGSDTNVAPNRISRIVGGAFLPLTMEDLFAHAPTTSNAIEFTKEASFTNSAAEASEGAAKAESALTWSLVNMPISTVAHWIKISRQLAADAPALAAYVNTRMRYGVNKRVDTQLAVGDGTAPNISGIMDSGNYTAHGYANAALGSTLKKLVLVRKIIADLYTAGYPAEAIVFNPADWATIEIDLITTAAGQTLYNVNASGQAFLFGLPVVQAIGMTADLFAVGRFSESGMIYDREGVVVDMSESDSDNFTKNLITLRAERRLALATEKPAAIIGGDLTPA